MSTPPVDLTTPVQRMEFLKKHGVAEGFYLCSGQELLKIQEGTSKLNGEIQQWRSFSQVVFGVNSPESALTQAQMQKKHRQGIFDDRLRYRNALMEILIRSKKMMPDGDTAELGELARKAINND